MVDLLIKQVTEGLSAAEQRALDVLDNAITVEYLRDFERAAAAISLAGTVPVTPPADLRARLDQQAARYFAAEREATAAADGATRASIDASSSTKVVAIGAARGARVSGTLTAASSGHTSRSGALGWFAAAACLLLALFSWLRPVQLAPVADVSVAPPPVVVAPVEVPEPVPPTPAELRAALLASAQTVKVTLGATKDPAAAGVTGDVVWDPATQKGYVHFVGLATNDPSIRQYQIWIFDGKRDKRYPVDGGVFDVPADSGEVVIPIHAALSIGTAAAFAVTVEKPGGAVVSGLEHVVVLGKPS